MRGRERRSSAPAPEKNLNQSLLYFEMSSESFFHFTNRVAGRFLCFVGGFVDSTGYILLSGLFTASVTGNIVKFSASAAENGFAKSMVIVTIGYGSGGALVRVLTQYLNYILVDTDVIGIIVLALEAALLVVTIFVGNFFESAVSASQNYDESCVLITGVVMALPMGVQFGSAFAAFPQFPNTTGMTASVNTSFSALANLVMLYLSECGLIHFYLSKEELEDLESESTPEEKTAAKEALYKIKKEFCFDELDRQLNPLLYFTLGAITGVLAARKWQYRGLSIPVCVVLFLIFEIYLARRSNHMNKDDNQSSISPCSNSDDQLISREDLVRVVPHPNPDPNQDINQDPNQDINQDPENMGKTEMRVGKTEMRIETTFESPMSLSRRYSVRSSPFLASTPRSASSHQRYFTLYLRDYLEAN